MKKLIVQSDNPEKDIEAIAKATVNRHEGNKITYWMVGSLVAVVVGVFVSRTSYIGWACLIGGAGVFLWYMNSLTKKQNKYRDYLTEEWRKEQVQK